MKLRFRDYVKTIYDIYIGRPARIGMMEARYKIELSGRNGYEINGIEDYWGRYGSIDKIVELTRSLKSEGDDFEFYYPAKKYDRKYSHRIGILGTSQLGIIEVEYLEASSQCGAYNKKLNISELKEEILRFDEVAEEPEKYGYVYKEF